ncbi:hypothetical protein G9A89_001052 [Geosiphon pyriformis]|nr:hypothetical protein G9A89_001052 [Geosiphon pyriformis]
MRQSLWTDIDERAIIQYAMKKILYNREKARNIYKVEHKVVIEKVTKALRNQKGVDIIIPVVMV